MEEELVALAGESDVVADAVAVVVVVVAVVDVAAVAAAAAAAAAALERSSRQQAEAPGRAGGSRQGSSARLTVVPHGARGRRHRAGWGPREAEGGMEPAQAPVAEGWPFGTTDSIGTGCLGAAAEASAHEAEKTGRVEVMRDEVNRITEYIVEYEILIFSG